MERKREKTQPAKVMHADTLVAEVILDARGIIESVTQVVDENLLPCAISDSHADLKIGLNRWLLSRGIGRARKDIESLKNFYGAELFKPKYFSSLFDNYWLKIGDETWEDINPYKNWDYEEDGYFNMLFDPENTSKVDASSPNLTIPGCDPKFWYVKDDKLGIINEASQKDMKLYRTAVNLGIDSITAPRQYVIIRGTIYSYKPSQTSEDVERIPFDILYDSVARDDYNKIQNLNLTCETNKIEGWREFFGNLIKLDEALGNKERSLCEIGVLRNTKTLEILGFELI